MGGQTFPRSWKEDQLLKLNLSSNVNMSRCLYQWVIIIISILTLTDFHLCPFFCSDCEGLQVRQEGGSRLCVLHSVPPRRVDLLRGRRPGALLLQLQDGEAAQNPDGKSAMRQEINHSAVEQLWNETGDYWSIGDPAVMCVLAHRFTIRTSSESHTTPSTTWSPPTARTVSCGYGNPEQSQCPHMESPGPPARDYWANHFLPPERQKNNEQWINNDEDGWPNKRRKRTNTHPDLSIWQAELNFLEICE